MTGFDASITGDELDSAVQLPNFTSVVAGQPACIMHDACYTCIWRKASFIYPRDYMYVSQESPTFPLMWIF